MTGITSDGSTFPVDISVSYLGRGEQATATCIIHDVSVRRRLEQQLREEKQAAEQTRADLDILYTVARRISGELDLSRLLGQVLETITGMDLFSVENKGGIFLREGDRLRLVAHKGATETFLELHRDLRLGQCLCGIAAETGETIISGNCHDDPRHSISYPDMPVHGHVIIPIRTGEFVSGVLYLYLPSDTRLERRQQELLETLADQLALAIETSRLFEEAREQSLHDPLTGLGNRAMMNMEMDRNMARIRRSGSPLSLAMLDLDRFKDFNDSFGHNAGDQLLERLAALLQSEIREVDVAIRFGGEEFLVIMPDTDAEAALEAAERIRSKVASAAFVYEEEQPPEHITVSLGVATTSSGAIAPDDLIRHADSALYRAKEMGRNRVESGDVL